MQLNEAKSVAPGQLADLFSLERLWGDFRASLAGEEPSTARMISFAATVADSMSQNADGLARECLIDAIVVELTKRVGEHD